MKKVLSLLVILTLAFTSLAMMTANAEFATSGGVKIYAKETANTVDVEVKMTAEKVTGIGLFIPYDNTVLSFNTATAGFWYNTADFTGWAVQPTLKAVASVSPSTVTIGCSSTDLSGTQAKDYLTETTVFKFSFDKINIGTHIDTAPTGWYVVTATSPTGIPKGTTGGKTPKYSAVDTFGSVGNLNINPGTGLGNPSLFTSQYDKWVSVVNHTVTFYNEGGTVIVSQQVEDGKDLAADKIPAVPEKSGFTGVWNPAVFTNITGDVEVHPVYTAIPPAVNTITASITGKGRVYIDDVLYSGKVTLPTGDNTAAIKIIPNLGYKVDVATLTGATGNIVAPAGGPYDATVSGDATLTVSFVPVNETIGANKPLPSQKVFKGSKDVGGVPKQANTTFAAAPTAGIVECGIYLKKNGADYTNYGGPYFKSKNTNTTNGQYGIEFVGFESGTYIATPYVRYSSETEAPTLAGTSVTFVVD